MGNHLRLGNIDAQRSVPLMDADEAVLGAALIAGRREAHSVVWLRFHPLVARIARQSLASSADVADVVQDVFVSLLNCGYSLKHPEALRNFIVSMTRFTVANHMKRHRRRQAETLSERHADSLATVPDPAAYQTMGRVFNVLGRFGALSRSVFLLRFIYGLDLVRISDLVGRSPATVKRRLAYVRRRLLSLVPRQPQTFEAPSDGEPSDAEFGDAESGRATRRQASDQTLRLIKGAAIKAATVDACDQMMSDVAPQRPRMRRAS